MELRELEIMVAAILTAGETARMANQPPAPGAPKVTQRFEALLDQLTQSRALQKHLEAM